MTDNVDLNNIKALALDAQKQARSWEYQPTEGECECGDGHQSQEDCRAWLVTEGAQVHGIFTIELAGGYHTGMDDEAAKFIAACSPKDVLAMVGEIERLRDLVSTKIEQVEFLNRSLLDECKRLNADNERLREAEGRRADFDEQVNLTGGGR